MKNIFYYLFIKIIAFSFSLNAQWVQIGSPGGDVTSIVVSNSIVFTGTDGAGVYLSTDNGQNWTQTTLDSLPITSLSVSGSNIFVGTFPPDCDSHSEAGVYLSTDNGQNWTQTEMHDEAITSLAVSGANVFAGTRSWDCYSQGPSKGVYLSTDDGLSWTQTALDSLPISSLSVSGSNIFAGTSYGLYRSTDNGQSWTQISFNNLGILSLAVSGSNVYANTWDYGNPFTYSTFYRSTDNGNSWIRTVLDSSWMHELVLTVNGSNVFAGSDMSGVYLSTDNGETWSQINEGMGNLNILSLAIGPNYIYAGTEGASVWRRPLSEVVPVELTSFTASVIEAEVQLNWTTATETNNKGFEIYRNGKKISFVDGKGTTSERQNYSFIDEGLSTGLYNYRLNQIDLDGTQKVVGETAVNFILPEQFSLEQNYPNPFNPSTKISWQSPISSWQILKVFDVLGNEVATLMNEYKPAGKYQVEFDGSGLPSGVYLYKLQAGNFTETKKLMLLK